MCPGESGSKCRICRTIETIRAGAFANLVAELPNSFVILGDAQFYRGYCILFAKRHATEVHLMPQGEARALFDEAVAVGSAISVVMKPLKLNYECLGNEEPHVHWHVLPRYETDSMRRSPVWLRQESERKVALGEHERRELVAALRKHIAQAIPQARLEPIR